MEKEISSNDMSEKMNDDENLKKSGYDMNIAIKPLISIEQHLKPTYTCLTLVKLKSR
jgi:hypothetical protein